MFDYFRVGCLFQFILSIFQASSDVCYGKYLRSRIVYVAFMLDERMIASIKRKFWINLGRSYSHHQDLFQILSGYGVSQDEIKVVASWGRS